MRNLLVGGWLVLGMALATTAAPLPQSDRVNVAVSSEAQAFAQQLHFVLNQVSRDYVREIPMPELASAATQGLYEAARLPCPTSLLRELEQANQPDQIAGVLAKARHDVGEPPAMRGRNALAVSLERVVPLLDPHCAVLHGDDLRRGQGFDLSKGFGVEVTDRKGDGTLAVSRVLYGGSAQRAGIRPGDEITHVDGRRLDRNCSFEKALLLQTGEVTMTSAEEPTSEPRKVELTLRRVEAKSPYVVSLEHQEFRPESILGVHRLDDNSWNYWIDREAKLAHVRVSTLANNSADELNQVLSELLRLGLRGMILDLRYCPGGYLNQAVSIAELFVGQGKIATVQGREAKGNEYQGKSPSNQKQFAIVVLVNGESSGGAELIAAAIQDNQRGVVVGQRSLGKGSVQSVVPLPIPEHGLKLTTATLSRPNGKSLHRFPNSRVEDDWGVRPDVEYRISKELQAQLKEWWQRQSLRPGACREALPLDDPSNDPQAQQGLSVLRAGVAQLAE